MRNGCLREYHLLRNIGIVSVAGIEACARCGLRDGFGSCTGDLIVVRGLVTVCSDDVVIGPSLLSAGGCFGTVP